MKCSYENQQAQCILEDVVYNNVWFLAANTLLRNGLQIIMQLFGGDERVRRPRTLTVTSYEPLHLGELAL